MTLWTDEARARAKLLFDSGDSFYAIAIAIGGVSRSAIAGLVFRMDWTRAPTPRPPRKPRPSRARSIISGKRNGGLASRVLHAIRHPPKLRPPGPVKSPLLGAPTPLGVAMLELGRGQCRWPVNDPPRRGVFLFCAHPVTEISSYCPYHHRASLVRGRAA